VSRGATTALGAALSLAAVGLVSAGTAASAADIGPGAREMRVIVSGVPGASSQVDRAVRAHGGHVTRELGVVNGVAATMPSDQVALLQRTPGVRSVTPDSSGTLQGVDPALGYDVANDEGSLYNIGQATHAKDAWAHGWTGAGVDVALIDSGVAPVKGLTSGNVVDGPDLSFESQDPATAHLDTYGHGTHMGSIIAGRDVAAKGDAYAKADSHQFNGVAPDARLVSIKVADNQGRADVSQVIAAIDWVTQHANSDGLRIRVLNLSYGTDSTQDPAVDPLCFAVENAWRAGIVVVVSSGNDGTSRKQLADPAIDPLVLAVGADDTRGTDSVGDDVVPDFAQRGTAARHVDIIAPGLHVLGLRNPGSRIDEQNASAAVNGRFFRGSGTSQAAAVASGLAALYLSRYPTATPDQVKRVLMQTATAPSAVKAVYAGLGVPDINKALGVKPPTYAQASTGATGSGSLEGARGSSHLSDGTTTLSGEQDVFGQAWTGSAWAAASGGGTSWADGDFNGHTWTGHTWTSDGWSGHTWTGHTWTGNNWSGHTWTSDGWSGHTWTDRGWTGHTWTSSDWDDATWTGSTWSAATWS
jgi:serine protease AprX